LLWQNKERADDSLTIGLWNIHNNLISQSTRWTTVRAFLEEHCIDIMFLQEVKAEDTFTEKMLSNDIPNRYYEYVGLKNEAGIYYDSLKLEVKLIDSVDYGVLIEKTVSGKSIDQTDIFRMREYTVLFTRKYTSHEQRQNYVHCVPYSFLAMSYHAMSTAKEDVKLSSMEDFFGYVSQLQNRVSNENELLYPIIIGMDGNLDINKIELPSLWTQPVYDGERRNISSTQKENNIIDYFIYHGRGTSTTMWLGDIKCINIAEEGSKTKAVFSELEPEEDIGDLSNHDPIVAYCAFKHNTITDQTNPN